MGSVIPSFKNIALGPNQLALVWIGPVIPEDYPRPKDEDPEACIPATVTIKVNVRIIDAQHKEEEMRNIEEAVWKYAVRRVRWQYAAMAQLSTFATVDQAKKFISEELDKFLE